jgi:hypothetical protein
MTALLTDVVSVLVGGTGLCLFAALVLRRIGEPD